MFMRAPMKASGIDVTLRNNPDHVLAPDDKDILIDYRFGKMHPEKFKEYYLELLRNRWEIRRQEFVDLVKEGSVRDINLKCTCAIKDDYCHATLAAKFLNKLIKKVSEVK